MQAFLGRRRFRPSSGGAEVVNVGPWPWGENRWSAAIRARHDGVRVRRKRQKKEPLIFYIVDISRVVPCPSSTLTSAS